ncbi:hypothetical protein D1BOALGB6SA_9528 [Olavius sp. associated proteobacterium Delta 1]|nr:hypothetical protein D1BOALGB6SA_9528 [Olavius sp. associated proteobacterium Delta 1]
MVFDFSKPSVRQVFIHLPISYLDILFPSIFSELSDIA